MGFPKIRGTLFVVPEEYTISGSILGSSYSGKLPYMGASQEIRSRVSRVNGSGFGVFGLGLRLLDLGFGALGLGFTV